MSGNYEFLFLLLIELSHVAQARPEGTEALSPGRVG